jgi:hypothetical protein
MSLVLQYNVVLLVVPSDLTAVLDNSFIVINTSFERELGELSASLFALKVALAPTMVTV